MAEVEIVAAVPPGLFCPAADIVIDIRQGRFGRVRQQRCEQFQFQPLEMTNEIGVMIRMLDLFRIRIVISPNHRIRGPVANPITFSLELSGLYVFPHNLDQF